MLLVCLIWGANFVVTKLAFAEMAPLAFTSVRFLSGSVLLALIVRAVQGPAPRPPGKALLRLLWLGVCGNTLYQLGFVFGLSRSTATNTSLILSASPAVVAILAAALGLERPTARAQLGIVLGIAGVAVVVLARGAGVLRASSGDLLTVGALLSWAVYTVGLRSMSGLSPLRVTAWVTYTGTPGIVLAGLPDLLRTDWRALGWQAWAALAYATVASLILGYLLWNRSVRAVGETRTAIYMCVVPLVALLCGWAILGERPSGLHVLGGTLIVAGVLLTRFNAPPPPET